MFNLKGLVSRKARFGRRTNRFHFTDHSARQPMLLARSSHFEHLEDRRMLADGDIDLTFGTGGFAFATVDNGFAYGAGSAIAVQTDGKIVAGGFSRDVVAPGSDTFHAVITRFNPDGTLDSGFADDGIYVDTLGGGAGIPRLRDLAIDAQGRILWSAEDGFVSRLNPDGTLDSSFGYQSPIGRFYSDESARVRTVNKILPQPDGSVVLVGRSYSFFPASSGDNVIFRLTANGLPDSDFGIHSGGDAFPSGGMTVVDFENGDESIFDAAQTPDGKFVVVGNHRSALTNDVVTTVLRFNADGTLDTTLGAGGRLVLNDGRGASTIAIDSAGRYVIGTGGSSTVILVRLNPDGTYDSSFGGGDGVVQIGTSDFGHIRKIVIQSDGRIVAVGSDYQAAMWRFNSDGTPDLSFDQDGFVRWEFALPNNVEEANDVAIQADGKIVAVGYHFNPDGDPAPDAVFGVVRFHGCDPVGWWQAEGNAFDSADGNDGQLVGGATYTPGQIGQAFSLDGVDDAVEIPESPTDLDGFSQLTLAAWINVSGYVPDASGGLTGGIMTKYDSTFATGVSYTLFTRETRNIGFYVAQTRDDYWIIETDADVLNLNTWTHVVGTWRGGDDLEIYVDGSLVPATLTKVGSPSQMSNNDVPVNIGRYSSASGSFTGPNGYFDGLVDDARIYSCGLSDDDIESIYLEGVARPSVLSGRVFDDANNDGLDVGDTGLAGVTVTLTGSDDQGPVNRTTLTLADGSYSFSDVFAGTYTLTEVQSAGLLDGKETTGSLGGTVDNTQDSNTIANIVIGNDGVDATGYDFAEIRPSDLQGLVWQDFNNDGEVNFGEKATENVTVAISGTDDRGNAVNVSAPTDVDGVYMFVDLRPGVYTLTETQPAGFDDGLDIIGTVNGIPVGTNPLNDVLAEIVIPLPGSVAENYNFAERPPAGGAVTAGQTATIGFWQNNNGQALIESLNGGSSSTQLGNWLAATFVNMYGASAGANDLSGMANSQVADFYSDLFRRKKKEAVELGLGGPVKMDAQVMAVALATYVTNESLAGLTGESFGFLVTENGVGTSTFNVGDSGQAFNVADQTELAVLDLLFATNQNSRDGVLYDVDGDGDADDNWETTLRTLANDVYSAINESGDI